MEIQARDELRSCPLFRKDPELFEAFAVDYGDLVQTAVRETVSRTDENVFARLRVLARRAGENGAVPQDLIAVHLSALAGLVRTKPHTMIKACMRQSRLLLVKMIGELALYYRERAAVSG
jgi:hypothetical protein